MNARVTVLHDTATEAKRPNDGASPEAAVHVAGGFEAEVVSLKEPVMELKTRQRVENGAPLRIDTTDAVWLGEAEHCSPDGGSFAIRVRLRHVLRDFETLARLAERFGVAAPKLATEGKTVQV